MDRFIFSHRTSHATPYQTEKRKVALLYWSVTMFFGIFGFVFAYHLQEEAYVSIFLKIHTHFSAPFSQVRQIQSAMALILRYSLFDLTTTLLLFLFSFSVLNHIVTEMILGIYGFHFGFLCCVLIRFMNSPPLRPYLSPHLFAFHLFCAFFLLFCYLRFANRLADLSRELNRRNDHGRSSVTPSALISTFRRLIEHCGWIFFVKILYCFLIFYF